MFPYQVRLMRNDDPEIRKEIMTICHRNQEMDKEVDHGNPQVLAPWLLGFNSRWTSDLETRYEKTSKRGEFNGIGKGQKRTNDPNGSQTQTETLSEKEFKSGIGEVIKYAFIGNKKLYKLIQNNTDEIKSRELKILEEIVEESIKTKARIVTQDEKESGIRAILNFGHTFGHAIEAFNDYKNITHGAAITLGMIIASKVSYLEGHIKIHQLDNIINLIDSLGLNTNYKKYNFRDLKQYIMNDKKVSKGKLNLVLIDKNGKAFKTDSFKLKNIEKSFN